MEDSERERKTKTADRRQERRREAGSEGRNVTNDDNHEEQRQQRLCSGDCGGPLTPTTIPTYLTRAEPDLAVAYALVRHAQTQSRRRLRQLVRRLQELIAADADADADVRE